MVQPERVAEESKGPQRPRALLIAATVGVFVVAVFTLGRLTAPDVEATESTATTDPALSQPTTTEDLSGFRVTDIATGLPVRWVRAFGIGDSQPVGLLQHGGTNFYYFGRPDAARDPTPTEGLHAWFSDDGVFWSQLGMVIGPEYQIDNVVSTDGSLTALGRRTEDGSPVILLSDDARTWAPQVLPTPRTLEPGERFSVYEAAAEVGRTSVIGGITFDSEALLAEYLPSEIDGYVDEGYGLRWTGRGNLDLIAPWGIVVFSATREDLGIPTRVVDMLDTFPPDRVFSWTSTDGGTWAVSEVDAQWIEDVAVADDGTITLMGWTRAGRPGRWTSGDGLAWTSNERPPDMDTVVSWAHGYAGISQGLPDGSDIMISEDGAVWTDSGANTLLPGFIDWWFNPLSAGEAGIATFAEGINEFAPRIPREAVLAIEKDGYRLTLDPSSGFLRLSEIDAEESILSFPAWNSGVHPLVAPNLGSREVTFLDPDSGEPLISFGFDELEAAGDTGLSPSFGEPGWVRAFLFSPDGEQWSLQDVSENLGLDWVPQLLVADDRLLAITVADFDPRGVPDVSAWLGIIPDHTNR